jgi:hypothetical protein
MEHADEAHLPRRAILTYRQLNPIVILTEPVFRATRNLSSIATSKRFLHRREIPRRPAKRMLASLGMTTVTSNGKHIGIASFSGNICRELSDNENRSLRRVSTSGLHETAHPRNGAGVMEFQDVGTKKK